MPVRAEEVLGPALDLFPFLLYPRTGESSQLVGETKQKSAITHGLCAIPKVTAGILPALLLLLIPGTQRWSKGHSVLAAQGSSAWALPAPNRS